MLEGPSTPLPEVSAERLIRDAARRTPDGVAVKAGTASLTYRGLEERVTALAVRFASVGVGPGARVGLAVERSVEMVVALLAAMRAGAAWVSLDPAFPRDRLAFVAEDADLRAVVTRSTLTDRLPAFEGVPYLLLDGAADPGAPDAGDDRRAHQASTASGDDPAYLIYTSGSTGRPKGVVVPHRALVNFLLSMARRPGLDASDTLVAVTTLSFDIAILELLLPLTVGGTVVVASEEEARDPLRLVDVLEGAGATVMQATPTQWRTLVEAGWEGDPEGFRVLCGGEPLPADLAPELHARSSELWNMYGPTETTIWSTCHRIVDPTATISIGRPIGNTRVHLLDEEGNPVAAGEEGELCIGGAGVALGYHRREELTRSRFVPDRFREDDGLLYRTGDLARLLADGTLEHRGRMDAQVKVRGFRVELGEIEAILAQVEGVLQVVAGVAGDPDRDPRLVAFLRWEGGSEGDSGRLRGVLEDRVPHYMVPQHFVGVEEFPRTANGKIDRKALTRSFDPTESPASTPGQEGSHRAPPETPSQRMVAHAFGQVLPVADIGAGDDFFDLGGHSVLAMRVIALLRRDAAPDLTLGDLFEAPTVAGLAARIDELGGAAEPTESIVI